MKTDIKTFNEWLVYIENPKIGGKFVYRSPTTDQVIVGEIAKYDEFYKRITSSNNVNYYLHKLEHYDTGL